MAKYQFLTPEWVAAAKAIREEFEGESPAPAHSVRMNQIITEVPFGDTDVKAFMDTSDGALNLDLGELENPDLTVTVAAVQGNVPRLGLDFNAQRRAVLDNHVEQTLRLADEVHAGRAQQPQFVIWPENSSDIDPLANADARERIQSAATISEAITTMDGGWADRIPATSLPSLIWNGSASARQSGGS